MAYSQAIVQRAMQRLQSENEQNEQSSRARIAVIYEKQPRLGEIERELRRTAAHVLAATFRRQGDPVAAMQQLKKDNLALQQERDWILQAEGLEPDDLTVQPLCPKCGGTGYVGAQMCECLRELCRQEQKKELAALFGTDSFEKFRLELYSDQYDAKCHSSPRELMRATYRRAELCTVLSGRRTVSTVFWCDRARKDLFICLHRARRCGPWLFRLLCARWAAVLRI